MCELCAAEAIEIVEVLPGWTLVRATVDADVGPLVWRAGQYALSDGRPLFYFPEPPRPMPPEPGDGPFDERFAWYRHADRIYDAMTCGPPIGHELYRAALAVGFEDQDEIKLFGQWITDRMGRALRNSEETRPMARPPKKPQSPKTRPKGAASPTGPRAKAAAKATVKKIAGGF